MVNVWEVNWWNGSEWDWCELYTLDYNPQRVREVFISQMYDDEVCDDITVTPEGSVKNESHIPVV